MGDDEAPDLTEAGGHDLRLSAAEISDPQFQARYELDSLLGSGGMGEVSLVRDRRLQREIALKVLRASAAADPELRKRFQREALLQARLDHPAIVPVYDYESTDDRLYFTMKRVRGRTLRDVIDAIAEGDEATRAEWGRGRLLSAFVQVCRAIDYAHAHGVLHRDLKPQNVMLGGFGEVHVIDWGIAKHLDRASSDADGTLATIEGESLGTIGYMAPEQIVGDDVTPATDVFSLGAIVFEVLGGGPLVPPGSRSERATATLKGVELRVRERARELEMPPELEAVVLRATMREPRARYGSARELAEAVQRYLDGDRDAERRRELADECVRKAERMLAIQDERARAIVRPAAVKELARALALDPSHDVASALLGRSLLEPPAEVPAEARAVLERTQEESEREAARTGTFRYLLWLSFAPWYAAMGVRDWVTFTIIVALTAASALLMGLVWKGKLPTKAGLLAFVTSTTTLAMFSRAFSPLVIVASLAATNVMFFSGYVAPRERRAIVLFTCLAIMAPYALEMIGAMPASFTITDETIVIVPWLLGYHPTGTLVFMIAMTLTATAVPALAAGRVRDALTKAQERLAITAWQLGELVPKRKDERGE
ncbi:serine/threonine-protein kinase [Sandaracinus amylolyticus]|uniref:Serine/threonine-protein kinase PknB n=1 Tax=Sandaracinus amylolyticus TaxID=927083 RepID=A0A0F6YP12_9BACT|nr:serine/threonine-protein kinase [Sandaracinus amylolyticus]AKF10972.1 Serine/threonine-protein kinase PknB [Sandaracinus amylolyticus]